jgi:uncharacterized membrane protein
LILTQLGLLPWLEPGQYWIPPLLVLPLLLPLPGLWRNRRYTFKWVGFPLLFYFAIGASETFANEDLWLYGLLTLSFSTLAFLAAVYHSRYLGLSGSS